MSTYGCHHTISDVNLGEGGAFFRPPEAVRDNIFMRLPWADRLKHLYISQILSTFARVLGIILLLCIKRDEY